MQQMHKTVHTVYKLLFVASSLNRGARYVAGLCLGAATTDHGATESDQNGDSDELLHNSKSPQIFFCLEVNPLLNLLKYMCQFTYSFTFFIFFCFFT